MITRDIRKSKNLYKILGPVSSRLITELTTNQMTVFTSQDAAQILGIDTKQVKKLLYDLVKKGWLRRIEKGKFFLFRILLN